MVRVARWFGLLPALVAAGMAAASRPLDGAEPAAPGEAYAATHVERAPLPVQFETLTALRLTPDGKLLAADGVAKRIRVLNAEGKEVGAIRLPFAPEALAVAGDGAIYVGGEGALALLSPAGELRRKVALAEQPAPPAAGPRPPRMGNPALSGMVVTDEHVFLCVGSAWSLRSTSNLYRYDRRLEQGTLLAEGLRGCCQRCDLAFHDGRLYVAENTRFQVAVLDLEGKPLDRWGGRSREGMEGFGACCNPMNLAFDAQGRLYTAESGLGRIKCYRPDGELLHLVGHVDVTRFEQAGSLAAACSNIAVAVTPEADRIYVMDFQNRRIRVLVRP